MIPAGLLRAQAAPDQPTGTQPPTVAGKLVFDVASIRQNKTDNSSHSNFSLDNGNAYFTLDKSTAVNPNGGYFSATGIPLLRFIIFAYNLTGTQELAIRFNFWSGTSSNVPKWAADERFDIEARSEDTPMPTKDQVRQMMRSLLEDRFKLAVHMETRQVPVFALVLDKPGTTGPQLRQHARMIPAPRRYGPIRSQSLLRRLVKTQQAVLLFFRADCRGSDPPAREPGRVLSAPRSRMSAPSSAIQSRATAACGSRKDLHR